MTDALELKRIAANCNSFAAFELACVNDSIILTDEERKEWSNYQFKVNNETPKSVVKQERYVRLSGEVIGITEYDKEYKDKSKGTFKAYSYVLRGIAQPLFSNYAIKGAEVGSKIQVVSVDHKKGDTYTTPTGETAKYERDWTEDVTFTVIDEYTIIRNKAKAAAQGTLEGKVEAMKSWDSSTVEQLKGVATELGDLMSMFLK